MKNPFEKPPLTPKHIASIEWLQKKIKEGLTFHDCLRQVEEAIDRKDTEQALINCYYTANIIIKSNKTDNEKLSIISGLKDSIENLKNN